MIGEVEEEHTPAQGFRRRSGTAECSRRSKNFVVEFGENGRPKTGTNRSKDRYRNKNQTIDYPESHGSFQVNFNDYQ